MTTIDTSGNLHRGKGAGGGQFTDKRNSRPIRGLAHDQAAALRDDGGMFTPKVSADGAVEFYDGAGRLVPIRVNAGWSSITPGLPIVQIDTDGLPEDVDGEPSVGVFLNDGPIHQVEAVCDDHRGRWGEDSTCSTCTDGDGRPLPVVEMDGPPSLMPAFAPSDSADVFRDTWNAIQGSAETGDPDFAEHGGSSWIAERVSDLAPTNLDAQRQILELLSRLEREHRR